MASFFLYFEDGTSDGMQETFAAQKKLELHALTPYEWAPRVLQQEISLLNDHAHLEKKAASNALELLFSWPGGESAPSKWVKVLSAIAKDESSHLALVLRVIERRGAAATRKHKNPYAQKLREFVRKGAGPRELIDRLLVSAMIELRSAERFLLLGKAAEAKDLQMLYRALWRSECGHYRVFHDLAKEIRGEIEVRKRWEALLTLEAEIIQSQDASPRIHSWVLEIN